MIPQTLHRVWPGNDPMPPNFIKWGQAWEALHPEWRHVCWFPGMLEGWMRNQEVYDAAASHDPSDVLRFRSCLARLEILYREGGVYVDTDTEPLKSIEDLRCHDVFLLQSPNHLDTVTDCAIGAEPGHPFFRQVLDAVEESVLTNRRPQFRRGDPGPTPVLETVGPWFLTRELERYGRDKVCVLPWWTFAGASIADRRAGRPPDLSRAYADHKWNNSRRRDGVGLG